MTNNAGKVLFVKKILCYLLIVWLTLMSVGANAHVTTDAACEVWSTHEYTTQQDLQDRVVAVQVAEASDPFHAYVCNQSHCCYGNVACMLTSCNTDIEKAATAASQSAYANMVSGPVTNNIDRPKWSTTTLAVVNLLG